MSYDIYIGNAELRTYRDEHGEPEMYRIVVEHMTNPEAPVFPGDEMTGNGNSRHPGYTQWGEFLRMVGLSDLFNSREDGLMYEHPGNAALREAHAKEIEEALEDHRLIYPEAVPRFGDEARPEDAALARLIWLDWWVKYALKNCERPCIYNY